MERRTDADLWDEVSRRAGPFGGTLVLVTEASFARDIGALRFHSTAIQEVLTEHARLESVFNGDVILIAVEQQKIACVHHESALIVVEPA